MVILSQDNFPMTIIDQSDPDLFMLMKGDADKFFDGEASEMLIYMLIKKNKCVRFTHDFKNNKLYIDFPDIK